jgi:membrane-bound lytic murein transglycosylase F
VEICALRTLVAIAATLLLSTCSQPPSVLDQILAARELRVVTRNSPSSYYLGAEGPQGPEFDLVRRFANELGVAVYIYSVPTLAEVHTELAQGRAHLAAAGLTLGQKLPPQVTFGPPYQQVKEQLLYRMSKSRPRSLAEANDGHIEVVASSPHEKALERMQLDYPALAWVVNPGAETEELLGRLANGEFDYTIADSNEFSISRTFYPNIQIAFDLNDGASLAWAVDTRDPSLLNRVTAFFAAIKADGQLKKTLDRYYTHTERFDYVRARDFMAHIHTRLPQYREWFKEAAEKNGVDWRLLAAIGYQESQWQATAISPTGVRGLMMLTEDTARNLNVSDRLNPRDSIFGGAMYFIEVRSKVPPRIAEPDRSWFALAAYNIGFGHLEDARILAQSHGKDPDKWDEVKEFLPYLTQEKWYTKAKNGYARGFEPVRFVENVRSYLAILEWVASERRPLTDRQQTIETATLQRKH